MNKHDETRLAAAVAKRARKAAARGYVAPEIAHAQLGTTIDLEAQAVSEPAAAPPPELAPPPRRVRPRLTPLMAMLAMALATDIDGRGRR